MISFVLENTFTFILNKFGKHTDKRAQTTFPAGQQLISFLTKRMWLKTFFFSFPSTQPAILHSLPIGINSQLLPSSCIDFQGLPLQRA